MSDTPEERRAAQIDAMIHPRASRTHVDPGIHASAALDRLLAYFDATEPRVADAIRYGLQPDVGVGDVVGYTRWPIKGLYRINYPEGHEGG